MYNLNVNVLSAGSMLGQGPTPRTPEIVNSLISMTNNAFFEAPSKHLDNASSLNGDDTRSSAASPLGSNSMSPPSVQHTRSQLIKEGLKLTLQSKRKFSGSDSKDEMDDYFSKRAKTDELTEEDEERRKRRRERNKIAATKCRLKKREKTANLVTESEVLESQNIEYKTQIKDLERQVRGLQEMLSQHACVRLTPPQPQTTPTTPYDTFQTTFIDPDFGDNSALLYDKDPNLGKILEGFYPHTKSAKSETLKYHCEEEDPDVYRPNGFLDTSFFIPSDNGYNNMTVGIGAVDQGCRA